MKSLLSETLTSFWALIKLVYEAEWVLDNIKNGQESACETEKLAETIETKVDQITSQIHHLEGRRETNRPVMKHLRKNAACLRSRSFYL